MQEYIGDDLNPSRPTDHLCDRRYLIRYGCDLRWRCHGSHKTLTTRETGVADAIYQISQNLAELQHAVSALAKQIDDQHARSGKQQKTKQPAIKVDRRLHLPNLA
jgi:hypothetical protein